MDWLDIVPAHYNFVKNEELFEIVPCFEWL